MAIAPVLSVYKIFTRNSQKNRCKSNVILPTPGRKAPSLCCNRWLVTIKRSWFSIMPKDEKLNELIDIVKNIGKIYDDAGIRVEIDFDFNDGMILIKHQDADAEQKTCIINSNNKTVSGIDTTKFWLPDYSREQTANKKLLQFLQTNGYSLSTIKYRKNETKK